MKRTPYWIAWLSAALLALLALLNVPALMAPAPLNLVLREVQVPLGAVVLGAAGVVMLLFVLAGLGARLGTLLELRRLAAELRQARERADHAEASRIDSLRELVTTEFRRLHEQLQRNGTAAPSSAPEFDGPPRQRSLMKVIMGRGPAP